MNITESEKLAIDILRPHREIIQSLATKSGEIEINKLYDFYFNLANKLKYAKDIRKGNFEDVKGIIC